MPDDAFGAALIEQAAALSAYARRLTGGGADADDLLQDTMLRCWTARASFAAGTSLAAWARTVMKNSFLTGRRRARFHADLPEEARDRMLRVDETQSLAVWLRDTDWALSELPP
ncbi:RNA polymerase sigma factor, partial [Novosphingobium panipatense]